jgi:TonB family protein
MNPMPATLPNLAHRSGAARLADEALCLLLGSGLTLGLFIGVAHFEDVKAAAPPPDIEDLRAASAIFEAPPPKAEERPEQADVAAPLTGLEIGASDSPVKLSVVPPDLDKIIPPADLAPRATIQFGQLLPDLKPKTGPRGEFQRIYQQNEVDQAPAAVIKTIANISRRIREDAASLRVTLVLVVDTQGAVTNIRVLKTSGNAAFDSIVLQCVRDEWVFSPAIKKGRKVRCMVQQLVWYKWPEGSKFSI